MAYKVAEIVYVKSFKVDCDDRKQKALPLISSQTNLFLESTSSKQ